MAPKARQGRSHISCLNGIIGCPQTSVCSNFREGQGTTFAGFSVVTALAVSEPKPIRQPKAARALPRGQPTLSARLSTPFTLRQG